MYRLVVSDIDGTLVDKEGKLHPETIAAVRRIQQKGILFTVSTGRNIKKSLAHRQGVVFDGAVFLH